jgi:cell division protease FtsH
MKNQKLIRFFVVLFGLLVVLNVVGILTKMNKEQVVQYQSLSHFIQDVKSGNVKAATIVESGRNPLQVQVQNKDDTKYSFFALHDSGMRIVDTLTENKVKYMTKPEEGPSFLESFFFSWGPTIFFLVAWIFLMKKMGQGGKGGVFGFGQSKAKLMNPDEISVTFADVVGCDESKLEIEEFTEFLKNPDKFAKLGGKTPRGVLLTGPAGTGKTMLAKALAKESGVPFFTLSGSDFVEMFVGVGASRVRDMFEKAKKYAPCVIFIDEIDAIGGKRGGIGGGNDEREQTLNQLLVELDGMDSNKGIILVGATNRPETLDKALLRPGRIDRQIIVGLPDVLGRQEILKIHSKGVPLSVNVELNKIARGTPGFSGAELANLINEAALFAARRGKKFVEQSDLEDAKDKIMMGVERPSLSMTEKAKRETAYHESGHAVVARLVKNADPVYKVTIIPRGRTLGVTMQLPEQDRWSHDKEFLTNKIAILMGGRAAEEVFCNTLTNGASNDISVATDIANNMVTQWGMSDLGPVAFGSRSSSFLGSSGLDTSGLSQNTLHEVNIVVRDLINNQYKRAKQLLEDNKDIVEAMTESLMEVETIDDWQIENLIQRRPYNDPAGLETMKGLAEERDKAIEEQRKNLKNLDNKNKGEDTNSDVLPA